MENIKEIFACMLSRTTAKEQLDLFDVEDSWGNLLFL